MIDFSTQDLSFGEIHLLFSEEIEYCILGVSATIFLVVLCLLIWQIYRYCTTLSVSQRAADGLSAKSGGFQYATQTRETKLEVLNRHQMSPGSSYTTLGSSLDLTLGPDEEHAQGSLRFSLFYDQLQSRLVVTVLDAQYLAVRDFSLSVDPFVWVRLLWAEREEKDQSSLQCVLHEWQTRLVKKSCSPVFGDQFSCALDEEEVSRVTVRFEVRDYDKYSRYGILGETRVSLNNLKISYPLELRHNLQVPKKDMVGEVLLSLKYMPTSQRLEVGVLKIRTVSHPTKTERALYAKASVICNQCKLRHQRTTQRKRWEMTVFNEVLTFLLQDPQIRECSIIINVYELHPAQKSSRLLIGQIHLEKGSTSENEHWRLMMQSLRQPIAKWHFLLI
ncbi:Synaptotagmin-C Synaptic vesicle protein O-p65-C [Triplophysa tibetana]|uniref:Synaptotagmin-C Synaptic vesicle protein O-p65-C n=1 Tax=Triplophysa tibetana TaxID=1572043 RepID=A0A5A9P2H9_9TELE|nr:Synaptotagmin-C Synaptic vesicle protein O-p65-C [Triplophysa tibetana]